MKRSLQIFVCMLAVCVIACSEENSVTPPEYRLTSINDGGTTDITYSTDGNVDSIKYLLGSELKSYRVFDYEGNRLSQAVYYASWDTFDFNRRTIFDYDNGKLVKVKTYLPNAEHPDGFLAWYDTIIYKADNVIEEVRQWTNFENPANEFVMVSSATYVFENGDLKKLLTYVRHGVGEPETHFDCDNKNRVSDNFVINYFLLQPRHTYLPVYAFPSGNVVKESFFPNNDSQPDQIDEYELTYDSRGFPTLSKGPHETRTYQYEPVN